MGKRPFEEATVVSTGVQNYEGRFGKRQRGSDYGDCPPTAHWRCNLTALSQERNLYFVAYNTNIYVYVPQYPTQFVPHTPALIVSSQPSSPGLAGTIDPRNPHSINSLVVQHLGNEEVVAAVRDDGDVDAFLVRHIASAIEKRAEAGSSIGPVADELRPIFQSNVGQSAWGLAIHTKARIIAVSANTHNITVFKFGLARDVDDENEVSGSDSEDSSNTRGREEVVSQVINGSSNIPHIAFCNTGDDPKGQWLLTTDIGGNCRAVNLDRMQTNQTFRFGPVTSYLENHDRFNSGWGVFFLDKRSFIPEDDVHAALGLEEGERLPGIQSDPTVWDISETANNVPQCAAKFSSSNRRGALRHGERRSTSIASPESTSHSAREPASSPPPFRDDATLPEHESNATETEYDELEDELEDESDDPGESAFTADLDFDDEGTEDTISFSNIYGGRRIYGNTPRAAFRENSICDGLPCPILHASVRNVYLLQPHARKSSDGPFRSPTVGFTNALHQMIQAEHAWLNAFERLNMHLYIPAIGIVVLASQKGRAMVISLTKLSKRAWYPAEMQNGQVDKKTNYAMRIEHILPFQSQEEQVHRPFQPLHGIAASPIQQGGARLPESQRRWRLMLMYADHSILCYEISRRRSRDSAVDLGTVVV
ncbi:Putative ribonucleotide reductase, transcriptional regulator Crt10 [Septoria linicola]|uniref:Ribonucleotide reductase, transcriptional regulator Crt10 n=1 Tax=Septoria linicola TaxID=215465 RepID=A0A9Q9APQ6_9PEZI|nr:putative ribonucleotide reductase, transcriptional regulator Crt10 [Septoria linicola]USW49806.1 Putative ribonucleotide reductase, transcriptional regulator Crt10 [Septoria linicola]